MNFLRQISPPHSTGFYHISSKLALGTKECWNCDTSYLVKTVINVDVPCSSGNYTEHWAFKEPSHGARGLIFMYILGLFRSIDAIYTNILVFTRYFQKKVRGWFEVDNRLQRRRVGQPRHSEYSGYKRITAFASVNNRRTFIRSL